MRSRALTVTSCWYCVYLQCVWKSRNNSVHVSFSLPGNPLWSDLRSTSCWHINHSCVTRLLFWKLFLWCLFPAAGPSLGKRLRLTLTRLVKVQLVNYLLCCDWLLVRQPDQCMCASSRTTAAVTFDLLSAWLWANVSISSELLNVETERGICHWLRCSIMLWTSGPRYQPIKRGMGLPADQSQQRQAAAPKRRRKRRSRRRKCMTSIWGKGNTMSTDLQNVCLCY